MTDIRLKLIISPGGARGDFVAGWTGLLSNCIDNQWTINPLTGKSTGFFKTKLLNVNQSLQDILTNLDLRLDPGSNLFWVSTCHGWALTTDIIEQMLDTGAVEIYAIDHRNVPHSTIVWEFIVKTYLTHLNTIDYKNTSYAWEIDKEIHNRANLVPEHISNTHRIKAIKDMICEQQKYPNADDRFLNNPRITVLDYDCLFRPGGSYYLCEKFNLVAEVRLHEYWDYMLPVIESPDSIDALGYTWRKKDFFN